jgi:hypothetical protein
MGPRGFPKQARTKEKNAWAMMMINKRQPKIFKSARERLTLLSLSFVAKTVASWKVNKACFFVLHCLPFFCYLFPSYHWHSYHNLLGHTYSRLSSVKQHPAAVCWRP